MQKLEWAPVLTDADATVLFDKHECKKPKLQDTATNFASTDFV